MCGKFIADAGMDDWVEQIDTGPDCDIPNGGIGMCLDPKLDCPPETECWNWICEFGYCVYVLKQ